MRLMLLTVGRLKAGPERGLVRRYAERAQSLARGVGIGGLDLREIEEGDGRSAPERMREEARGLQAALPAGALTVCLDARGRAMGSADFAALVGAERDAGRSALALVIGGPDGLDPALRARAPSIAYGAATFPHQIVRVLAAEQIYRALTILAGHPYHRA